VVFLLCLGLWAPGQALAQDFAAAGQHFAVAQDAFQAGQYKRAAEEYQAAYDITRDGGLLFNIGESWQRAGDAQKALAAYRAYIKDQPEGADRPEAEKRVQALEAGDTVGGLADRPGLYLGQLRRWKIGNDQTQGLSISRGLRADAQQALALRMHAGSQHDIGPSEVSIARAADVLVDEAHLPRGRQVRGNGQNALRRHQRHRVREEAKRIREARKAVGVPRE